MIIISWSSNWKWECIAIIYKLGVWFFRFETKTCTNVKISYAHICSCTNGQRQDLPRVSGRQNPHPLWTSTQVFFYHCPQNQHMQLMHRLPVSSPSSFFTDDISFIWLGKVFSCCSLHFHFIHVPSAFWVGSSHKNIDSCISVWSFIPTKDFFHCPSVLKIY